MIKRTAGIALVTLLLAGPGIAPVAAQVCLGVPNGPGQFSLMGTAGFQDGTRQYGGSLLGNLEGPLAFAGTYAFVDFDAVDENGHAFAGTLAYELGPQGFSVCPFSGVSYVTVSFTETEFGADVDVSTVAVPVGIAVGTSLSVGDGITLNPFVAPQLFISRTRLSVDVPGVGSQSDSETDTDFGVILGAALGVQRVFLSGAVMIDSVDETDPAYSISLGFTF